MYKVLHNSTLYVHEIHSSTNSDLKKSVHLHHFFKIFSLFTYVRHVQIRVDFVATLQKERRNMQTLHFNEINVLIYCDPIHIKMNRPAKNGEACK